MGVQSGMDYAGMKLMIRYIEEAAGKVNTVLNDSLPSLVPKIAEAYSGVAAEQYKAVLTKTAEDMNTTLTALISKLNTTTEEMQDAYKAQEAKMAASVKPVQNTTGGHFGHNIDMKQ